MFTPGPNRKCTPLARASRPSSVPTRSASMGFHVAASPMPPAMAVAGPKLRTPIGPSAIRNRGSLRRETSRMKNPSTPPSRSIFSSSVIWLRMDSTRCSTSIDGRRREGVGDWACALRTVENKNICMVIKQSVRMRHLYFLLRSILFIGACLRDAAVRGVSYQVCPSFKLLPLRSNGSPSDRRSQSIKLVKLAGAVANGLLMHTHAVEQRQIQVSYGSSGWIAEVSTRFQTAAPTAREQDGQSFVSVLVAVGQPAAVNEH